LLLLLQFLAFRLGEVKRDCQQLQDQLANSKVGCMQACHLQLQCQEQHLLRQLLRMSRYVGALLRWGGAMVAVSLWLPPVVARCLQGESCERQQQLSSCQQQLSSLQERHSRQTLELEAQLREQAAAAQQDKLDQVAAVRAQLER
jgi:hypothetical protein